MQMTIENKHNSCLSARHVWEMRAVSEQLDRVSSISVPLVWPKLWTDNRKCRNLKLDKPSILIGWFPFWKQSSVSTGSQSVEHRTAAWAFRLVLKLDIQEEFSNQSTLGFWQLNSDRIKKLTLPLMEWLQELEVSCWNISYEYKNWCNQNFARTLP